VAIGECHNCVPVVVGRHSLGQPECAGLWRLAAGEVEPARGRFLRDRSRHVGAVPGVEPSCDGRVRRRHDWERDGFISVQMHMKSTALAHPTGQSLADVTSETADRLQVNALVSERIWDFARCHEVTRPIVMNSEAAGGAVLKIL
jgi:hypothetical protein